MIARLTSPNFKKTSLQITMKSPKATDVKKGIAVIWETLQCPICLDLMTGPVSTKCDHQFCKFCIMKLLDNSKQNGADCPVCKTKITKRSLRESHLFQRLVTGLQDMIQAYEHDTGTNYFTGMSQQKRPLRISSGDASGKDLDTGENVNYDDLPRSHSSTIAAQNGFATLMGLEDSGPSATENEGLDSGLGDAPPTSDKKMSSPTDDLESQATDFMQQATSALRRRSKRTSAKLEKAPDDSMEIQDAAKHKLSRKSSRKEQRPDLERDEIFEQKKKKSLEKVAEWLLKVPADGDLELEKPQDNEDDSDSCSSTSTIDMKIQIRDQNSKRVDRSKGLEEQVFGAIYKRRSNRGTSPPLTVFVEPSPASETQTHQGVFKVRNGLTPAEGQQKADEIKKISGDIFEEAEQMEVGPECEMATNVEELHHLSESEKNPGDFEVPSSVFDIEQQPEKKTKRRTRSSLQDVDADLQEQAQAQGVEQKKHDRRKFKNTRSEKSKLGKVSKPLVLVGVNNMETSPKVGERLEQVQVQIENFPSSEEQDVPIRSSRRSRRLQLFADEVQNGHKKVDCSTSKSQKDSTVEMQPKATEGETLAKTASPEGEGTDKAAKRNGCVYDQDIGGIESMEIGMKTPDLRSGKEELPRVEGLSEDDAACGVSVVPNSQGLSDTGVVGPTFEGGTLTSMSPHSIQQETSDRQTKSAGTEKEEDKPESELDTEQLLRSFKTTKRKSFHLGKPARKKSRHSDKENVDGTETEENQCDCPSLKQITGGIPEASKDPGKSPCSDFISPSKSPIQTRKVVIEKPREEVAEGLISESTCSGQNSAAENSGLSPNKVSKRDRESPPLSVVPQVVDSGLRFTVVEHVELDETSKGSHITEGRLDDTNRDTGQVPEVRNNISDGDSAPPVKHDAVNTAGHILIVESSLTPDDLVVPAAGIVNESVRNSNGSGEASVHSSVRSHPTKRRRAQRLESSSETDSSLSKEELPTLQEIFGTSACSPVEKQDQGDACEANRSEGECAPAEPMSHLPAPASPDCVDSSQASVDLFGTPEECDVPVNDTGVSIESSQFSSEVLVTQQKIEMRQELVRLEKLMALVSEVLQEKEETPTREMPSETQQSSKTTGPDADRALLCDQDPGQGSDGKDCPDAERNADAEPCDDEVMANPSLSRHGDITDTAVQLPPETPKGTGAPKILNSTSAAKTPKDCASPSDEHEDKENNSPPKDAPKAKLVLVSSGLSPSEQITVKKFAKRVGARVASRVTLEVTHIIMHTDEQLVCERTLKYFLGIAGRKWVVSFQWISECFKQKKLLDESPFEVKGDVVNGPDHQGPSRARNTEDINLLMKGYKICFQGPFTDMTTDEMELMVELCGATVIKDPLLFNSKQKSCQLVIVQPRSESSSSTYRSLSRKATVVSRGWLLDTVATYTLKDFNNYTT